MNVLADLIDDLKGRLPCACSSCSALRRLVVGELQAEGFPWLTRVASEAQLSVSPDGALDFVCLRAVISNALADLIDVIQGPLLCAWVNYLALRSVVVELQAEALLRYPGCRKSC